MNKKGMLYKRTFSAAASALMAISAIAPMSVFAAEEEFEPVTVNESVDFDNEGEEVKPNRAVIVADNIGNLNDSFVNVITNNADKDAVKNFLGDPSVFEIRTSFENADKNKELGNTVSITRKDPKKNNYEYKGTAEVKVDLGSLLALDKDDKNFVRNAVKALDIISDSKNAQNKLSSSSYDPRVNRIEIKVSLQGGAQFGNFEFKPLPHTISNIEVTEVKKNKTEATLSLEFNNQRNVQEILDAINGKDTDYIKVKIPYTGTFVKGNNESYPDKVKMSVSITQGALFSLESTKGAQENSMRFVIRQNGTAPSINLLKNSSISAEPAEPAKPQKPSGTLTGGYPTSKPGSSSSSSVVRAMHRLYNPKTGEHFYTQSAEERDNLVRGGWNNEGIGWHAPAGSSTPVYRVFNPNSGDHHYTTNLEEYQTLTRIGWNAEGIGWYSESDKGAPIYRLYNKKIKVGSHHYTQNPAERDKLVNEGWVYEGIAWYAMK